jgi:hypothetical protein
MATGGSLKSRRIKNTLNRAATIRSPSFARSIYKRSYRREFGMVAKDFFPNGTATLLSSSTAAVHASGGSMRILGSRNPNHQSVQWFFPRR